MEEGQPVRGTPYVAAPKPLPLHLSATRWPVRVVGRSARCRDGPRGRASSDRRAARPGNFAPNRLLPFCLPAVTGPSVLMHTLRRRHYPLDIPRDYVEPGHKRLPQKARVLPVHMYTVRNTVMSLGL